jgi:hypothetical protein
MPVMRKNEKQDGYHKLFTTLPLETIINRLIEAASYLFFSTIYKHEILHIHIIRLFNASSQPLRIVLN